jgi:hypothetical protein
MGRFTLRDEGKTIAVGKVLKYKPYSKGIVGSSTAVKELTKQMGQTYITTNSAPELVYDMETGEMRPKQKEMDAIAEGEEDQE